jgi:hypothetical protein
MYESVCVVLREDDLREKSCLVVVDAKGGGATEEGVVDEDVGGEVVGVRVPQAASAHANAFSALLAEYNFHYNLA